MKWFKHISDSLDDPFIYDLITRFGGNGYLVFFGCLELMAREFDVNSPGSCRVSQRFLSKKLQLSRQKTAKILKYCDEKKRILMNLNENYIELKCPRFKELYDEYTLRKLANVSGQKPDSIGIKSFTNKNKIKNKIKKKNIYTSEFEEFWKKYPNHEGGKQDPFKSWNKINPDHDLVNVIMQSIDDHQKKSWAWNKGRIPYATTWLNQGRWTAEFGGDDDF